MAKNLRYTLATNVVPDFFFRIFFAAGACLIFFKLGNENLSLYFGYTNVGPDFFFRIKFKKKMKGLSFTKL